MGFSDKTKGKGTEVCQCHKDSGAKHGEVEEVAAYGKNLQVKQKNPVISPGISPRFAMALQFSSSTFSCTAVHNFEGHDKIT